MSIDLKKGDKLTTRCGWINNSDNTVSFGEKTGDEMCFGFLLYYPRVDLAQFAAPAIAATCAQTTGL